VNDRGADLLSITSRIRLDLVIFIPSAVFL